MDEESQVQIYTTADSAQATALVNLLAEQGISALVVNEDLQSGSSELLGPRVMPRIVVREADEQAAREIAQRFDQQVVEQSMQEALPDESDPDESDTPITVEAWPLCPSCREPRHTTCPVCGTAGSEFPFADAEYSPSIAEEGESGPRMHLICTTCDEPFVPVFLRRCQWCSHDFGEGLETDVSADSAVPDIEINPRVLAVGVGLLAVFVLLVVYFAMIAGR